MIITWNNTWKRFFKRPVVFVFLEHTEKFFQFAVSCATRGKGLSGLQPTLGRSFRNYNPKAQVFKRVLVFGLDPKRGVEGASNVFQWLLNFSNLLHSCSYGFKNGREVIEMVLKSLFFAAKSQKFHPAARGSASRLPLWYVSVTSVCLARDLN